MGRCGHSHGDERDRKASSRRGATRNYDGPWPRTPGRLLGIGFIRLYQLTLSGFVGGHCRHIPTCSEYGFEAIARHGLLAGGWLTAKRVARCNPFGTAGLDPVPTELPARAKEK
ncbi:membrane protein insertion efficiency factor YidD [Consotaella salsifontis]|uniref:Putative membrane protein insertion efficiency factor n=1 Tax=Consotaella salsifontis TaxID=1365950 RepID=A0A1T4L7P7_9HYPH|nr:membrane protein insertion efficiency factor YidD [Consotaella salsifontis]SJZ50729.1 hypothetical protein SAMN05428963_10197 [Consotaella salsifontis]